MKKINLLLILLMLFSFSFSQVVAPSARVHTKQEYLKKSKTQKIIGYIMAGTGAVICVGTAVDGSGDDKGSYLFDRNAFDAVGYIAGGLLIGGSIPLFMASDRNAKKAASLSGFIKMEKAPRWVATSLTPVSFPAAGIKIDFR